MVPFDTQFLVANRLTDLPADLAATGVRSRFPLPHGRRDEFHHGSTRTQLAPKGPSRVTSTFLHIDGIEVKTRRFR